MINWVLFSKEFKANLKLFIIFWAVLAVYAGMIVAMFDPKLGDSLNLMAQGMPQLFAAFGMDDVGVTLLEFVVNYLYDFLFVVFPAVFIIIVANRLVVRYVDDGSMAYLLATPHTRKSLVVTQMRVLSTLLFLLVALAALFTWAVASYMFPGELEIGKFVIINVALYGLLIFLSGLCFCFSCWFNDARKSFGWGAGLVIAFVLIQMLSQVGDKFEFLKYATPLTLFNTEGLMAGDSDAILMFLILYIAGIALYFLGMEIFAKKDIPV